MHKSARLSRASYYSVNHRLAGDTSLPGLHHSRLASLDLLEGEFTEMRTRLPFLILPLIALILCGDPRLASQDQSQTQQQTPAPTRKDIATLKARDLHQDLLVAADPWMKPEEYKARFGKKTPYDAGIVAIDVYFRNDGAQPLRLNLNTIRLTVSLPDEADQELAPLRPATVAAAVYDTRPRKPGARRLPIGGGSGTKQEQELMTALRDAQLSTDLIPPKLVVNGLLYFDVDSHFNYIAFSRLYIPDLSEMGTGKLLFFYDVPLGPPKGQ